MFDARRSSMSSSFVVASWRRSSVILGRCKDDYIGPCARMTRTHREVYTVILDRRSAAIGVVVVVHRSSAVLVGCRRSPSVVGHGPSVTDRHRRHRWGPLAMPRELAARAPSCGRPRAASTASRAATATKCPGTWRHPAPARARASACASGRLCLLGGVHSGCFGRNGL